MEVKPNKSLAMALGKFSDLLIKGGVIDPDKDESALFQAVDKVVQNFSQPEKKPILSSAEFVKGPLANLMAKHQKSQNKIEELRKQKYFEEVSQLKDRPTISKTSKKLVKVNQNNIPPLHQRTEKLLKEKTAKLESERTIKKQKEDEETLKQCTFRPKSREKTRSRSPESLTKELYK